MTSKRCLIVSVVRKHTQHANIVDQLLRAGYDVREITLPQENAGECSVKEQIPQVLAGVDLILIYLSNDVSANVCVGALLREGEKCGIRVVSIWLDQSVLTSIPAPADIFSDSVTQYGPDLIDVFVGTANPWVLPDGSEPPKRKIKKHTCG